MLARGTAKGRKVVPAASYLWDLPTPPAIVTRDPSSNAHRRAWRLRSALMDVVRTAPSTTQGAVGWSPRPTPHLHSVFPQALVPQEPWKGARLNILRK